jgi:poly(3-hydroxybutyrate) depolymerase
MRCVRELVVALGVTSTSLGACSSPPPDQTTDASTLADASMIDAPLVDSSPSSDASAPRTCATDPQACSRAACTSNADALGITNRTAPNGATYVVYAPTSYQPITLQHLVLALHGGFGSPGAAASYLEGTWKPNSDTQGFLVLAPETNLDDAGSGYWDFGATGMAWILATVDDMASCYSIDASRITVGGFSSGGQEAYVLGLSHAERFSGISIAGASFFEASQLAAEAGMPTLLPTSWEIPISDIAGNDDPAAPLNGTVIPGMNALEDAGHTFFLHVVDGGHGVGVDPANALATYLDLEPYVSP